MENILYYYIQQKEKQFENEQTVNKFVQQNNVYLQ